MTIHKIHFKSIEDDNTMAYVSYILKCLNIVDEDSDIVISKALGGFGWTIRPSDEKLKGLIKAEFMAAHMVLGLEIEPTSTKHSEYLTFRLHSLVTN